MNPRITIATLIFPLGLISLIAKPVSAREMASLPLVKQAPLVLAQAYNNHRQYDQHQEAREAIRRNEIRRDEIRRDAPKRVWIPGHWESGFLGIGRKWVEGHWEFRG
ncbi:hypothetical protein [Allocoleopsis sp.]|uniref:hypothetical protein n=1 Tax=Allocoleopsis sp. TaxID=3088169 RepID=UPI002FCF9673